MKYRPDARPRTVQQVTTYVRSNGVDAEVIACTGFYCFRGGDPPGGWLVPHLLGFSLDGMTFGDWLRAYRELCSGNESYRKTRLAFLRQGEYAQMRERLFHGRWWYVRLRRHQESTASGRAQLREIGRRLSRFEPTHRD